MKKILSILAIAMIMMGLSACSGGAKTAESAEPAASTPEEAVKNYLNAMKKADIKALASASCQSDGTSVDISKEDPTDIKEAEAMLKLFSDIDFTIDNVDINGDRAIVEVTMKLAGEQDISTMECVKCSDGKWRVLDPDVLD